MKKIIGMIPARLGSQRVKKKNLRLIGGKPLISYVIEAALDVKYFDEIYINSESDIFSEIAEKYNISFYKRPSELSSDTATNDEFALDFINQVEGDILIQLLPTSPLITTNEIEDFVKKILENDYDTLISVEHKQIACVYNNKPVNFDKYIINPPSQTMTPVMAYATALMGWKYKNYISNMEKYNCAYHGGDGKTGYFELRGLSTIDIDYENDFLLAEAIIKGRSEISSEPPEYYGETAAWDAENHVESILKKDGVKNINFDEENREVCNVSDILASEDSSQSWSRRIINTESNSMTIISQLPGEGNRLHYHPTWNEWWYIVDGEWEWEIEGEKRIVKRGDIVFMRKKRLHKITAVGDCPAIRMAVSRSDVLHVYSEKKEEEA